MLWALAQISSLRADLQLTSCHDQRRQNANAEWRQSFSASSSCAQRRNVYCIQLLLQSACLHHRTSFVRTHDYAQGAALLAGQSQASSNSWPLQLDKMPSWCTEWQTYGDVDWEITWPPRARLAAGVRSRLLNRFTRHVDYELMKE